MDIVTRDCHGGAIFAPSQVGLNIRIFLKYLQPSLNVSLHNIYNKKILLFYQSNCQSSA